MTGALTKEEAEMMKKERELFGRRHAVNDGKIVYGSAREAMAAYNYFQTEELYRKGFARENSDEFRKSWARTHRFIPSRTERVEKGFAAIVSAGFFVSSLILAGGNLTGFAVLDNFYGKSVISVILFLGALALGYVVFRKRKKK